MADDVDLLTGEQPEEEREPEMIPMLPFSVTLGVTPMVIPGSTYRYNSSVHNHTRLMYDEQYFHPPLDHANVRNLRMITDEEVYADPPICHAVIRNHVHMVEPLGNDAVAKHLRIASGEADSFVPSTPRSSVSDLSINDENEHSMHFSENASLLGSLSPLPRRVASPSRSGLIGRGTGLEELLVDRENQQQQQQESDEPKQPESVFHSNPIINTAGNLMVGSLGRMGTWANNIFGFRLVDIPDEFDDDEDDEEEVALKFNFDDVPLKLGKRSEEDSDSDESQDEEYDDDDDMDSASMDGDIEMQEMEEIDATESEVQRRQARQDASMRKAAYEKRIQQKAVRKKPLDKIRKFIIAYAFTWWSFLAVLIVFAIGITIAGVIGAIWAQDALVSNVAIHWWTILIVAGSGFLMAILVVVSLIIWAIQRVLDLMSMSSFFNQTRVAVVAFSWGLLMIFIYKDYLTGGQIVNSPLDKWVQWIFSTSITLGIMHQLRAIAEELAIRSLGVNHYSDVISLTFFKERMIHILLRYARAKKLIHKRKHRNYKVKDLDLNLKSWTESQLMATITSKATKRSRMRKYRTMAIDDESLQFIATVADSIFKHLDTESRGYLMPEDLEVVYGDQAEVAFMLFDQHLTGTVDVSEFQYTIESIYTDRWKVAVTHNDRADLGYILRVIFSIIYWMIALVVVMVLAGVDVKTEILPLASFILGLSFAFGTVIRQIVRTFIMLLIVRPYDVGDRIRLAEIDKTGKNPMFVVYKIELFRTIVIDIDGQYHAVPNSKLITIDIENLHRSNDYTIETHLGFSEETPGYKIVQFKEKVLAYCKEHKRTYRGDVAVYIESYSIVNVRPKMVDVVNDPMFWTLGPDVKMGLWVPLNRISWHDRHEWLQVRMEFFLFIQKTTQELGIDCSLTLQHMNVYKHHLTDRCIPMVKRVR